MDECVTVILTTWVFLAGPNDRFYVRSDTGLICGTIVCSEWNVRVKSLLISFTHFFFIFFFSIMYAWQFFILGSLVCCCVNTRVAS